MRINKSVIIIYSSTDKENSKRNKLIKYKNERYIEIMKTLVDEYDEIIIADICAEKFNNIQEEEERIIRSIYDALKKVKNNKVLVISSYMPLITKELINYMGKVEFDEDVLIPYTDDNLQKLCAIYNKNILDNIEEMIENNTISFDSLFENMSIRYIFPKDKSMFISVDKIEEYITYYM